MKVLMLHTRAKISDSGAVVWRMPPGPVKVRDPGDEKIRVDCYCGKKFWWRCGERPKSKCPKCGQELELVE